MHSRGEQLTCAATKGSNGNAPGQILIWKLYINDISIVHKDEINELDTQLLVHQFTLLSSSPSDMHHTIIKINQRVWPV